MRFGVCVLDSTRTLQCRYELEDGCSILLEHYDARTDSRIPIICSGGLVPISFRASMFEKQLTLYEDYVKSDIIVTEVIRYINVKQRNRIIGREPVGRIGRSTCLSRTMQILRVGGPGVILDYELFQQRNGSTPGPYHSILLYRIDNIIYVYEPSVTCISEAGDINVGLFLQLCRYVRVNGPRSLEMYQVVDPYQSSSNCLISCLHHMKAIAQNHDCCPILTVNPYLYCPIKFRSI